MRLYRTMAFFAGCALVGCSSESPPNSNDIKMALQDAINRFLGTGNYLSVSDISDISCEKSKEKTGFVCDFKQLMSNKKTKETHSDEKKGMRFVKDGNVWFFCPPEMQDEGACAGQINK